jgi:hypothetical protein
MSGFKTFNEFVRAWIKGYPKIQYNEQTRNYDSEKRECECDEQIGYTTYSQYLCNKSK